MTINKTITLMYQSSDQTHINNYEPISLLPVCSKIIEKLMFKNLTQFLKLLNLIYQY